MSDKPAIPKPSKLRRSADQLLPATQMPDDPDAPAEKVFRTKLMTVVDNIDFTAPNNLTETSTRWKDMNFKVLEKDHQRVKTVAVNWRMSMKELVQAALESWIDKHGEAPRSVSDFQHQRELTRRRNEAEAKARSD